MYYQMDPSLTEDPANPVARVIPQMVDMVVDPLIQSQDVASACEEMGKVMTEAKI